MLAKYLVLAFLPTIAYSGMVINIKPNNNDAGASIDFNGEEVNVITDEERKIFQIYDDSLKKATEKLYAKPCSDIYVKPPTPWGDVYQQFGWSVVKSKLKPFNRSIISISSKPVTLGTQEYVNVSNKKNITQHIKITTDVEESIRHTWIKGEDLGIGRKIEYNVNFGDESLGGNTFLSYSALWGEGPSKSRIVTVGNKTNATTTIPPGGKVMAKLMSTQHMIEIEIQYESSINGEVFCNYDGGYMGHKFYALPLRDLQDAIHTPVTVYAIEKISMSYLTNVKLEVSDGINTIT